MGTIAGVVIKDVGWREWLRCVVQAMNRLFPKRSSTRLSVQQSVPLGQKATAALLLVEGEKLLLGVTAHSVSVLRCWKDEAE